MSSSSVYAGGAFTSVGGQPRSRLAALDTTTGTVTGWNPDVGSPLQRSVSALAASGSTIYVGGSFLAMGGQPRTNLASVDAATGAQTDWNPRADATVQALSASRQTVYTGGEFSTIGGQRGRALAALDATTGTATNWNPDPKGGAYLGRILTLAVAGTTVYTDGNFASIGGQPHHNLAALNAKTGAATDWNPDPTGGTTVEQNGILLGETDTLATSTDAIYVGGDLTTIGGQPRNNLAAIDATTGTATDWNPNPARADQASHAVFINALAVADSTIYVRGAFTTIGSQPRRDLAALDATSGAATDWNPNGPDSSPTAIASALAVSGPTLYAGAGFSSIGSVAQQGFAEFTTRCPAHVRPPQVARCHASYARAGSGTRTRDPHFTRCVPELRPFRLQGFLFDGTSLRGSRNA